MRFIKGLFLGAALLAVALVVCGFVYLDVLVARGVELGGERFLGLATTVESAKVSLKRGTVELRSITVMGPEGKERLLFIKSVFAKAEPSTLFENPVRIEELSITGPELSFVPGIGSVGSGNEGAGEQNKDATRLSVGRFAVSGGSLLMDPGIGLHTFPLPDIVLRDLGGARGLPPLELAAAIVDAFTVPTMGKDLDKLKNKYLR